MVAGVIFPRLTGSARTNEPGLVLSTNFDNLKIQNREFGILTSPETPPLIALKTIWKNRNATTDGWVVTLRFGRHHGKAEMHGMENTWTNNIKNKTPSKNNIQNGPKKH